MLEPETKIFTEDAQCADSGKLRAYQVGDYDVVAAYNPQNALEVFALQGGNGLEMFSLDEVVPLTDTQLDADEVFNQDEGKIERLDETLRQQLARLIKPTYLCGWD